MKKDDGQTNGSEAATQEAANAAEEKAARIAQEAITACQTLLAVHVSGIDLPGGARDSVRVLYGDKSAIVTRRKSAQRARLEAAALYALGARGAPVPKVLAFDGVWLIQEDLGRRRLAQALSEATPKEAEVWLDAAIDGLVSAQRAAQAANLETVVTTIGGQRAWIVRLMDMPTRLGGLLDLAPPQFDQDSVVDMLRVRRPRFVKWDARPGNAIACEDGTVAWFDWEHAGCRNWLDDFGWLLADEYAPDLAEAEAKLIERHLPAFLDDGEDAEAALTYLTVFATIHSCVRLSLILTSKKDQPWLDPARLIAGDKVGVTREMCQKGLRRAAGWAAKTPSTAPLAPWFEELVERVPEGKS